METLDRRRRALSFGAAAEAYDRFRPSPPDAALEWLLPPGCRAAVDVGAGTGALTRQLVERVERVTAVEPDPRMRAVLERRAPAATVLAGRAESLPLPDASADAVLLASAWHWVDPDLAVPEVARVLRPGGRLGLLWTGVDTDVAWAAELWRDLRPNRRPRDTRHAHVSLPAGAPFSAPERRVVRASLAFTRAGLVGLALTYSGVLTLEPDERERIRAHAAERVARLEEPIDLPFACGCWRASRL